MKRSLLQRLLAISCLAIASAPLPASRRRGPPPCRFALDWTQEQILVDPRSFAWDLLFWEGKFHQDEVAYNAANGMTYDGTQLDWTTGDHTKKHPFSAASKEMMLYARVIAGSREAARFLAPDDPPRAAQLAASIMATKLQTYLRFNQSYPGFGGFLPWVTTSSAEVQPTWDWVNRVPALDNGELLWAVYACISSLERSREPSFRELARDWQKWFDHAKTTAVRVFYSGSGRVCAVTKIKDQQLPVSDPGQRYECEGSDYYLDDPYEGELFTHFLHLFTDLSREDKEHLWKVKRKKLVSVEYSAGGVGPITVEQGHWFSSHELWKVLELPYYDVDIVRRLYHNAERARTCNSVLTRVPGLFASVNNSTDPESDTIMGYISPAGIPSIASQKSQYREVVTPYGAWPTITFDRAVGLAWWHNMVAAKKMQNPYGSTESTRLDGELVSALVTWDSKVTTVVALLGGVGDLVRGKLKVDGAYEEFISVTQREYSRVFKQLKGEDIALCLPRDALPAGSLEDFTQCRA
ncbi:GPI anchored protein [Hirsutella rhossiliensis]|uniref:GPI anchored protein n=1 Tax=Hirsutella rhossiliensis TaxID=111463 RepID=A0A9P8SG67_9HYPO|nr:GPI anchored protein [Hirsutella rhossiliensis]KAH0961486.1 GPI anchored protein [Hirsutella rhossiliensis]